jgi:phage/plasmid-associated DNA primase
MTTFKIYEIKSYNNWTNKRIENEFEEYDLSKLISILKNQNKGYHQRIDPTKSYQFFGDCDKFRGLFSDFSKILINFLNKHYNIQITEIDISYTENKSINGSFHYSIPTLYGSCKKLKEIHTNLLEKHKDIFFYQTDIADNYQKVIDTTIYSKHWFRLPNQLKEQYKNTEHIIKRGKIEDFILGNIEKDSKCIDDYKFIDNDKITVKIKKINNKKNIIVDEKINIVNEQSKNIKDEQLNNNSLEEKIKTEYVNDKFMLFKKFFDECYKKDRFDDYNDWITVGFAIKNRFGDDGFDLFNYFSTKGIKYEGINETKKKYESFTLNDIEKKSTIASLYYFALKDNKIKYIELIKKYSLFKNFDMTSTDIAKYIQHLKPNDFMWKEDILYCYNGKYWEKNVEIMKHYISNELHDFLKNIIVDCFWDDKEFNSMKNSLKRLKGQSLKKEVIETTKEYIKNNDIEFDNKWWLFGFNNCVYDLKEQRFREYKYDDYVSLTTGYDWYEPTGEQMEKVYEILLQIFPDSDIRQLYLTILSTGFEGRCLEKLIIANGNGRNGKGMIDDLSLVAFGNYALIGNNALLFETSKTGSNPEKSNMHKKRLVIFKEPPKERKIQNSVYKELTGGGTFSARGLFESNTEKKLHNTTILECNEKPLFAEEPTEADTNRIIDILFMSHFTSDPDKLMKPYNYPINVDYKTDEFKENHKRALLKILFEKHKIYANNGYKLNIPENVKYRTSEYLEKSCDILSWFKDNYEQTNDKKDFIKLKDVYENYKGSDFYFNLTKNKKQEHNYKYFINYFSNNQLFSKFYIEKSSDKSNFLTNFKLKDEII